MTAPSNANTSGLEVVAWRIREQTGTAWTVVYDHEDHRLAIADGFESEPFAITAASAQARIAELEVALKPFAAMAEAGDQRPKDDAVWAGQDGLRITYGDFRAARAAL